MLPKMICFTCQDPLSRPPTRCPTCGADAPFVAVPLHVEAREKPPTPRMLQVPLTGRADEVARLVIAWGHARDGRGSVVLISGEAGIGKTRLAAELEARIEADAGVVRRFHGSPQHSNSDLYPLSDHLHLEAGVRRGDPDDVRADKIQRLLTELFNQSPTALLHGLVALSGAPSLDHDRQGSRQRRDRVLDAVVDGVADLARMKSLAIIVDDAQWLDPSSVELLRRLVSRAPSIRLLLVVTARREFAPDWIDAAHTTLMIPRRLSAADTGTMAARVSGADRLSVLELQQVVERSEGVPLFVEELTRDLATAQSSLGTLVHEATATPTVLQGLLTTRLDRLGHAKRLAQMAAAVGRRFSYEVGTSVWFGDCAEFERLIDELMRAEILLTTPIAPGTIYAFRHALIQDAAYGSMSPDEQLVVHERIVDVFDSEGQSFSADQPEILAYHCERCDRHLLAAGYWLAAGKASAARGSIVECVNYFKAGLTSARRAPAGQPREQLEFELNMNLGPALMALEGYTCDAGLEAFLEARHRLALSRSSMEQLHVLLGLFNVHFGRGELLKALDVAHQADRALAVGYGGYPALVGQTLCIMGRFGEARQRLQKALIGYDPAFDIHSGLFSRADVVATSFLAKTEFALGHWERAAVHTKAAMDLAMQQGHPISLAIAYLGQVFLAAESGDLELAQATADEAFAHATGHGLHHYVLWTSFHRAALGVRTNPTAAIASMEQILEQAAAAGTLMFRPAQLGLLGAIYSRVGKHDKALAIIDGGIGIALETHGLEPLPALYRLRAKTLIGLKRTGEAILDIEQALHTARAQAARTEELRAATLYVALLKDTARHEQALAQLASLYATFDHQMASPDLRSSARLLANFGK
jgi:tetratricopeptide (TPR) repeat protein